MAARWIAVLDFAGQPGRLLGALGVSQKFEDIVQAGT